MADQEYSTTQTTVTTTTSSGVDVRCDLEYFKSIQGILKITEIVLSLVAFCVIVSAYREPAHNFFLTVTILCGIVSTIVLVLLSTRIIYNMTSVPWNLILAVIYIVMALSYAIAFIVVAAKAYTPKHGSAATLGCFASIVYFLGMLFAVRDWRTAASAQSSGGATSSQPTQEAPQPPATSLYDPKY